MADFTSLPRIAHRRGFRVLAATCLPLAAAVLVGCGAPPDRDAPAGTTVTHDGVAYSVQISQQLDPAAPDDRELLAGLVRDKRLQGPDSTLLGVWLQARNDASAPRPAVAAPRLVTAFGQTFAPLQLPRSDVFAYRGGLLRPGSRIPGLQTLAAQTPEAGLLLVYSVPADIFLTDRPFTLRFGSDKRAASVQLDL